MKKILSMFATVFVSAAGFAVDPVAVWDGDFSAAQTGYTLNLNNNELSSDKSTITISQNVGVTVTKDEGTFSGGFTVLVRYSDLNTALADKQVLMTSTLTDANDRTGVTINKSGKSCGIWAGNSWNDSGTYNSMTSDQSSGVLAFAHYSTTSYSGGYGTKLFSLGRYSAASDTIMDAGTLGSNNDKDKYKGFAVGGRSIAADGFSGAIGMKISGIAVFSGILSEQDMLDYRWPTDVSLSIDENTFVSALNSQTSEAKRRAFLSVADGVTLTIDEAFAVPVAISSEGSVRFSADSQPDALYFSGVDFSGVKGAVLRSWLPTPGVVGFNFNASGGRNGQGNTDGAADTSLALETGTWYKDAYSPSGTFTEMFADGLSLLTWKANNVYAESNGLTNGTFIQGYLDDGGNVSISLTCVPYETYDVIIYCSTDNATRSFKAKTVNGKIYTWDATSGETTTTDSETATWGLASAAAGKAVYGANTLRINNLTGPLSILGGTNSNNARGCISAIQIMPAGTSTAPEMTVGTSGQTTQANWTGASWNVATAPTSGNVVINVSGDVELTVDEAVALSAIIVNGEGSLKIIPDQPNNVTFTASSILSAVPLLFANDGIGIDTISAAVTYLYKTTSISSSTHGNTYTAGVGEQGSSVPISHNGGSVTLQGETYYLSASDNATATTVVFTNATATYSTSLGVGAATYIVSGQSVITSGVNSGNTQSFVLSQGGAERSATFLLKDSSIVNVTGTSDVDSNQAAIMFGHWNGPSTFTIQDSAAFNAVSQVLVGKTANNHTINLNGGTFTAKGIKASTGATGSNTLNLNGGLLVLGDVGITSYGSTTIGVNVLGDGEIRASAATLPITQPVAIADGKTLSLTKKSDASAATVALSGTVSGADGTISVGAGVTLNIGTSRPESKITVDDDGVLALALQSKADVAEIKVLSKPNNIVVYDTDGTTEISNVSVVYDTVSGTLTIRLNTNTWTESSDKSFDTTDNWSQGLPSANQDLTIETTEDVSITISGEYTAKSLAIIGGGAVTLSGEGSLTVGAIALPAGVKFTAGFNLTVTSEAELETGSELWIADTDVSLADGGLIGAGKLVLNPGEDNTFTMSKGNTSFTGEAVVASGTVKMGDARSFGEFNRTASIRVKTGATLDVAGASNGQSYLIGNNKLILEEGALFSNTVEMPGNNDLKYFPFYDLTVEGDATIDASTTDNGLARFFNYPTFIHLGTNTLTKTGDKTFYMPAVTIDGTGTIDVKAGTLRFVVSYYLNVLPTAQPSFNNGTFIFRHGSTLTLERYNNNDTTLTTKKIVFEGNASVSGTGSIVATDGVEMRTVDGVETDYASLVSSAMFATNTSFSATGDGTIAFGTERPTTSLPIGESVKVSARMKSSTDLSIRLYLSQAPAAVAVYDENGTAIDSSEYSYSYGDGELTISFASVFTIEGASGTVDFDDASSWSGGLKPSEGKAVIISATGDVTFAVAENYTFGAVSVTGGGTVAFSYSGDGAISAESIGVVGGTTLVSSNVCCIATDAIELEAGTLLRLEDRTETALISGAGAVETRGEVVFASDNQFTGGLTVKPGSLARTTTQQGFGKNNWGQAIANLSRIVVKDGGALDLNHTGNACYAITIAGRGIDDSGALFNSGSEIGDSSRQTASITLTTNAMVKAEATTNGWGIVNSGHAASVLALNGNTLTLSGKGYMPFVNLNTAAGTTTTGKIVVDGVTFGLVGAASNLSGVEIEVKGGSKLKYSVAPTEIGSMTIIPTKTENVIATAYNLPEGFKPEIDMTNLGNVYEFGFGDTYTMFARTDGSSFSEGGFTIKDPNGETVGEDGILLVDGDIKIAVYVIGSKVVVTTSPNFMHYDFNSSAGPETGCAADSNLYASFAGEYDTQDLVFGRNGKAVTVQNGGGKQYTPYWGGYSGSAASPFAKSAITVTTVARLDESNNVNVVLWGLGGANSTPSNVVSLVAVNDSTVAVVARKEGEWSEVVRVDGISNLKRSYHFIALVANDSGTTLYVDRLDPKTTKNTISFDIGTQGQLGSIHGGVPGSTVFSIDGNALNKVTNGYSLDDWAIYGYAMTEAQIAAVREKIFKRLRTLFIIR